MRNSLNKLVNKKGIALYYVAALMFTLLALSGLALDLGRGYVVQAHLSKAVDGAALAAGRAIGRGQTVAAGEADKFFNVNFPNGYLGVSSVQNPPNKTFTVNPTDGSNIITVSSNATLPTTFMKMAGFKQFTVSSSGQATKRLVDVSFVIDNSGSMTPVWSQAQEAAKQFVDYFDEYSDRMALIIFSSNTTVSQPLQTPGRGFNKTAIKNAISAATAGGNTASASAMYHAVDELRRVPDSLQSGLRIIVFFTDGAPNTWPGRFNQVATDPSMSSWVNRTGSLATGDFTPGQTAQCGGLYETYGAVWWQRVPPTDSYFAVSPSSSDYTVQNPYIPWLPNQLADLTPWGIPKSYHPISSSTGMPNSFPVWISPLDPSSFSYVGQTGKRPLINYDPVNGYPTNVYNTNNAARNLLEIIAHWGRNENPPSGLRLRIIGLGLGPYLVLSQGTVPEIGSDLLRRVANDPDSPDFNSSQLPGKYFYAGDAVQLNNAFQEVRNLILRLSQ